MTELDQTIELLGRLDIDTTAIRKRLERNRRDERRDRHGLRMGMQKAMVAAGRRHRQDMIDLKFALRQHQMVANLADLKDRCPTDLHFWVHVHDLLGYLQRGSYLMGQDGKYRLFDAFPD